MLAMISKSIEIYGFSDLDSMANRGHSACYLLCHMVHTARLLGQATMPSKNSVKGHPGLFGDFPIYFREIP